MTADVLRVAMWSGPRNLSSALMRSFSARADCAVWDEPFYAADLHQTALDHPLRGDIIAAGETDPGAVARTCTTGRPRGCAVFYQKHMTHHMLPGFPRDWVHGVTNAFLIRAPERVLASYARKRPPVTAEELGFAAQAEIFARVADRLGRAPPVVEAEDIRADPGGVLGALCTALGLAFQPAMLAWPAGPHPDDGVWGPHWYDGLWASTGFGPPDPPPPPLPPDLARMAETLAGPYEMLRVHRLMP